VCPAVRLSPAVPFVRNGQGVAAVEDAWDPLPLIIGNTRIAGVPLNLRALALWVPLCSARYPGASRASVRAVRPSVSWSIRGFFLGVLRVNATGGFVWAAMSLFVEHVNTPKALWLFASRSGVFRNFSAVVATGLTGATLRW